MQDPKFTERPVTSKTRPDILMLREILKKTAKSFLLFEI